MIKLKKMIPWVATTLSFAMISSAEAVTVNFGDSTDTMINKQDNVLSIDNLVICVSHPTICQTSDDQLTENKVLETYNVDFLYGSFENIFGADATNNPGCVQQDPDNPIVIDPVDKLCFWNDITKAELAQAAMNLAINNQAPAPPGDIFAPRVPQVTVPGFVPVSIEIFKILSDTNNPTDTEYLIPTGFNGSNLSSVRSSNETNNMWEPNTDPFSSLNALRMYTLFEFQGSETIAPPTTTTPTTTKVPESSSTIAAILAGVSVLLVKGKKSE